MPALPIITSAAAAVVRLRAAHTRTVYVTGVRLTEGRCERRHLAACGNKSIVIATVRLTAAVSVGPSVSPFINIS